MAKPQSDAAFKARTQPDPAAVFACYIESHEILARRGAAIQAAYAKHADDYRDARRWWDRIILEGRAGEFVGETGHSQELVDATMQTLRKWWIREGRPRV